MTDAATIDTSMSAPPKATQRTRDRILEVARIAMATGDFRPTVESIRKGAGLSVRSVFDHFGTIERLHWAAIGDPKIYDAIVALIVREPGLAGALSLADRDRIVRAAVFGKA